MEVCRIPGGRGVGAISLVSQRINGVELRGFPGGIITEENSHRGAKEESDHYGLGGDEGRPVLGRGNDFRRSRADRDPNEAAQATEGDRFDQELAHDITAAGTNGQANTDLLGTFAYTHEHDVHNADPA